MTKRVSCFLMFILLIIATNIHAANLFDGYEELEWGTHFHKVMEVYPKGQLGEYNKEITYIQDNPDETVAFRLFAFKDGKLASVAVTFNEKYVKKTGLENLKQKYMKQFGKGKVTGQGNASHTNSYVWSNKRTRITFMSVPNRPEMTVLQFEQR